MYNQYYTSADCNVFLTKNDNMILLDKMNGIMISEELNSYPIYGLGSSYFGFTTRGNYIVNGLIDINFIHAAYLTNAINSLENSPIAEKSKEKARAALQDVSQMQKRSIDELMLLKKLANFEYSIQKNSLQSSKASAEGIAYLKSGFNIKLILNNSNALRADGTASEIEITNCRIISSDITSSVNDESQLVRRYRFIGQAINERST